MPQVAGYFLQGANTGSNIVGSARDRALRMQELQSADALRKMQEQQMAQTMSIQLQQHNLMVDEQADRAKASAAMQAEMTLRPAQMPVPFIDQPDQGSPATVPNPDAALPEDLYMKYHLPIDLKYAGILPHVPTAMDTLARYAQVKKERMAAAEEAAGGYSAHAQDITLTNGQVIRGIKDSRNHWTPVVEPGMHTVIDPVTGESREIMTSGLNNAKLVPQDIEKRVSHVMQNKAAMENPDLAIPNPDAPGMFMLDPAKREQFIARQGTTTGVKTKLVTSLEQTQKTLSSLQDLRKTLRPEDIGLRGVVSNELLDVWLPQFGIDTADTQRMDNRTKLGALINGMNRQVSDDSRFSNSDREDIKKVLPREGVRESYPRAVQTIDTLEQIFSKRALIDARTMGRATPVWAISTLTKPKLLEAAGAGLIDEAGLIQAFKLGKITAEEAAVLQANLPKG